MTTTRDSAPWNEPSSEAGRTAEWAVHFRRYLLLWLVMSVIAPINGAVRELSYKDALGELTAHQVSSLIGSLVMAALVWWAGRRWPLPNLRMAAAIGLTWLVMTVAFEFGFGRLEGKSWDELYADYNLANGRVWGLVVAWIAALPLVVHVLQRPRRGALVYGPWKRRERVGGASTAGRGGPP